MPNELIREQLKSEPAPLLCRTGRSRALQRGLENREDSFSPGARSQRHSSVVRYCRKGFSLAIMFSGISVLGCDRGYSALNTAGSGGGGTVIALIQAR